MEVIPDYISEYGLHIIIGAVTGYIVVRITSYYANKSVDKEDQNPGNKQP
ncbi:hypothetical protein [Dysgonomonas termitidis]